jgi:hypothetical protein
MLHVIVHLLVAVLLPSRWKHATGIAHPAAGQFRRRVARLVLFWPAVTIVAATGVGVLVIPFLRWSLGGSSGRRPLSSGWDERFERRRPGGGETRARWLPRGHSHCDDPVHDARAGVRDVGPASAARLRRGAHGLDRTRPPTPRQAAAGTAGPRAGVLTFVLVLVLGSGFPAPASSATSAANADGSGPSATASEPAAGTVPWPPGAFLPASVQPP